MKYKIGDWIVFIDKEWSNHWKEIYGISLYGKIGKIIDINRITVWPYLIEFKEFIDGTSGRGKGKNGNCRWCHEKQISLYKDYFKLKKFIEG